MTKQVRSTVLCACGSGQAAGRCCEPFISGRALPPTADALMRSRYSAYVARVVPYVLETWQPSTRPRALALDPSVKWLGLNVKRHEVDKSDPDRAIVEFVARSRVAGRGHRLHEVSRFVRAGGRWFYVDAEPSVHT